MCWPAESFCGCVTLEVGVQVTSILLTLLSGAQALVYAYAASVVRRQHYKVLFYQVIAAITALQCLLGCLLIFGTFKKRPRLMTPWVVVTWCQSLMLLILSVVGYTLNHTSEHVNSDVYIMTTFFFFYSVLLWYCTSAVNSRRREILKETTGIALMRPTTPWKYV